MKRLTWFLLALTLANPVFSEKYCPTDYIESEKNIVTVYKKLRKIKSDCKTRQADYLSFCKRAFLSKKYSIAIWACRKGIKNAEKNSNEDITAELIYFLGISYIQKERYEDAIIILREPVLSKSEKSGNPQIAEKMHLALIEAYVRKDGSGSANASYLEKLFKYRYSSSKYIAILDSLKTG